MNKLCNSCGNKKPASDFHVRQASIDGLSAKCRECQREYDRARASAPHRVAARAAYQKTKRGMRASAKAKAAWTERNRVKRAAHIIVGNAIRSGRLTKMPCHKCGSLRAHAHHDDYLSPLDVIWLCPAHHAERHKELRQ